MMAIYCVQFAGPWAQAVRDQSPTPICMACAAGHHDQPILAHECCDCSCHGATPPESADFRVAA
jgi:hypothetical protein